jgi:hypothetical protein
MLCFPKEGSRSYLAEDGADTGSPEEVFSFHVVCARPHGDKGLTETGRYTTPNSGSLMHRNDELGGRVRRRWRVLWSFDVSASWIPTLDRGTFPKRP